MSDEIEVRDEHGTTRWIKAYTPGNLPKPGDVVWKWEFGHDIQILGPRFIPKDGDGDEGTVIV